MAPTKSRIRRTSGTGPLYFSAQAKFFSLEEPITPAGNEIFVRRQYFKLVNHPTLLKGFVSERVPLNDGETVKSGERVETVLTIEAKNNYEYLLFEDLKPAGLEAVQIRSGENLYVRELKSGALAGARSSDAHELHLRERFHRPHALGLPGIARSQSGACSSTILPRRRLADELRNARRESRRVPCAAGAGPRDVRSGDSHERRRGKNQSG